MKWGIGVHKYRQSETAQNKWLTLGFIALSLISIGLSMTHAADSKDSVDVSMSMENSETRDRQVDSVALESQRKGVQVIEKLLLKYKGKRQEPDLRVRLCEGLEQMAEIQFRIAMGAKSKTKNKSLIQEHKATLEKLTENLGVVISRHSDVTEIAHIYYMRAVAYQALEKTSLAVKDYLHLVSHYPQAPDVIKSYMALADISVKAGDHNKALTYLREVEKKPESPYYPFALYKMAWAFYNLKDVEQSLGYVTKNIEYYSSKKKLRQSDLALRENTLSDSTLFYLQGYEADKDKYDIKSAYKYFKGLEEGDHLGKMLLRYAKLLRSHSHDEDLFSWKNIVLDNESNREEAYDVVMTVYDHEMNKHRYNRVVLLATDIVNLNKKHPSKELASKSQKKLLDTADELQKIVLKNKNASDIASVSEPLAGIYDSFIQIVDENDPRVAKAHYNLAETLFLIKQYERAAQNYRWIVSRGMDNHKDVADSAIKAIASRYEVLSEKKLLPQKIEPKKLKDGDDDYSSDPRDEWLAWIDAYVERNETIDETFYYEANRLLYDSGRVKRAIERMKKFALRQPKSKYAIASATLAIDTYILSEAWDDLHDSAMVMLKVKAWTTPEFVTMLHKVNTEALYKIAEREYKKENYAEALYKSDLFLKEYKEKSPVRNAFLSMAGHSAYKEKKLSQALKYYSELVEAAAGTSYASEALLSKGKIAEELYDFAAASRDYQQYMNYPGAKIDDYRERVLLLSWMSGSKDIQEQALNSKTLCKGVAKAEDLCARYEALFYLTDKPVDGATIAYAEKNLQTSSLKHLWALYLLVHDTKPSFKTRNDRLKLFSKVWDKLEGLEQIALLHYINSALLKNIEQGREELAAVAPLKGKEKDILFRIQKMREYEAAVEAVVQMPWVRIKAHGLNQLAETYYGFVNELRSVPTPKDFSAADKEAYEKMIAEILMPFEEKAATLREKAFEIVNKFDVESETGKPIVEAFLKENPSQAKSYREKELITKHYKMGPDMLSVYDVNGDWETLRSDCQGAAQCTKYHWLQAIRKSDWRKAAHYLQVVNKEKLLPERSMMLMRAVSLATMGSRGEALQEVSDINLVVSAEVR